MSYLRAFSSLGCPDKGLDDALALARRHDLSGVELRALAGSTDLPAHFARYYSLPARLAAHLKSSGGRIAALDTSFELGNHTAADRAALLEFVPWAEAVGVPHLRVFDGSRDGDAAAGLDGIVATLRWWRELRAKEGWSVDLMVETHDVLTTTSSVLRLLAAAPGTAILWDAHHTWKSGEDPLATWHALRPHIVWVHLKDSISRPSARHPYTYVLPGTGEFPAAPLVTVLRTEFSGIVSLEWEKLWHPYLPSLDDALASAARTAWW